MELGYLVLGWGRVSGEEGVEGGGVETEGGMIKEMAERDFWVGIGLSRKWVD